LLIQDTAGVGAALREITRAIRQICLLQEIDQQDEASKLETKLLTPLINAYRDAHGAEALPDARIREIAVSEHKRASDAAALGELLAPLLAEYFAVPTGVARASRQPAALDGAESARRRRPIVAPEIADLLDGMLAQEQPRPSTRPRRPRTSV
jgi:hypothetical protein